MNLQMNQKDTQTDNSQPSQQHVDIPWFKRWEDKKITPPDPDFIARLEELEYK